jgi:Type II CAAX prenyl endopeptidase Rce1-like
MLAAYLVYRARSRPAPASRASTATTRPCIGGRDRGRMRAGRPHDRACSVGCEQAPPHRRRLVGPVGEEADFRSLIWAIVAWWLISHSARTSGVALVATTALVFALAHLQNHGFRVDASALAQLAYTLPAGLALGALRLRTDGILWPVPAHSSGNSLFKLLAA